jgi:hypothetical protein
MASVKRKGYGREPGGTQENGSSSPDLNQRPAEYQPLYTDAGPSDPSSLPTVSNCWAEIWRLACFHEVCSPSQTVVLGFGSQPEEAILTNNSDFIQSHAARVPQLDQNRFLPYPCQFVVHQPSYYARLKSSATSRVVK